MWRLVGAYSLSTISSCLLLLHVAIDAAPDGAERVDALVDPSSGVQPYGMNTERRAVEGTVNGTDATAVDATAGNATAVDHAPLLAMISHLARGGVFPAADSVRTRSAMVYHHAEGCLFGRV